MKCAVFLLFFPFMPLFAGCQTFEPAEFKEGLVGPSEYLFCVLREFDIYVYQMVHEDADYVFGT